MGRTYTGNNGSTFDVNFSGADLLALIHEEAGIGFLRADQCFGRGSTVFSMTEKEALKCATVIESIPRERLVTIRRGSPWLFAQTESDDEYIMWVLDWAKWLKASGGYEVQ